MIEIYNKLSSSYDNLYMKNINDFKHRLENIWDGDGWFVDFYPSFGIKPNETCDMLFYGQALNGWTAGFDVYAEIPDDKILQSIMSSNKYFSELNHTPLDWVNVKWSNSVFNSIVKDEDAKAFYSDGRDYRTFRSFFWKVVFKLTSDFYGLDRASFDWAKRTVWSNLYKITEDGANPNSFLREQQFKLSAELIKLEIEELKPKYCIVLTNYDWWEPFGIELGTKSIPYDKDLNNIASFEQLNETKFIITTRPRFGSGESHLSQLLKIIG